MQQKGFRFHAQAGMKSKQERLKKSYSLKRSPDNGQVGIWTRGLYHAKVAIFQLIYLPFEPQGEQYSI